MLEKLKAFVKEKKLFSPTDKILLAVSGGIDSVVMAHLFVEAGFNFGIAHCNFQLRGKESDKDALFVKVLAAKFNVPFFVERFETEKFAQENKMSIQMAARNLRYDFFFDTRTAHQYYRIATAHHSGDSAETILLNLVRGSGIAAYHGIKENIYGVIRPLLSASRNEIETYAKKKKIKWREDASNNSDAYKRNKIRHHVIPLLKELNPSLDETLALHASHMKDAEYIYRDYIETLKKGVFQRGKDEVKFPASSILWSSAPFSVLFEFIKEFGYSRYQANDILNSLMQKESKYFYSEKFELIRDRGHIFIREKRIRNSVSFQIMSCGDVIPKKHILSIIKTRFSEKLKNEIMAGNNTNRSVEYFDAGKISFPLTLRNKIDGEYFYPLGMKGKKLLSDFFTDAKYSHHEKENQLLLLTKNDVIWVVGKRMDDRFKITADTKKIFKITIHDKR